MTHLALFDLDHTLLPKNVTEPVATNPDATPHAATRVRGWRILPLFR